MMEEKIDALPRNFSHQLVIMSRTVGSEERNEFFSENLIPCTGPVIFRGVVRIKKESKAPEEANCKLFPSCMLQDKANLTYYGQRGNNKRRECCKILSNK